MNPQPRLAALTTAWRTGLAVAMLAAAALTACSADIPVVGPKCGAAGQPACPDGASTDVGDVTSDVQGDVQPVQPQVDFYLDTKLGAVLGSATSAALTTDNDLQPGKDNPGIQVDLIVKTDAPVGSQVAVKVGPVELPAVTVQAGEDPKFAVTVPCAATNLGLVVTVSGSGLVTTSVDKTISQASCPGGCQPPTIEPVAACLSADQDESQQGFQQSFTVTAASADCPLITWSVKDTDGTIAAQAATTTLTGTKATVLLTLSTKSTGLLGASATITATASDPVNTDREAGVSTPLNVAITTDVPQVADVAPLAGTLTLTDDNDAAAAGLQITLKGTVSGAAAGDPVSVAVDGAEAATGTVNVDGTFAIPLTLQEKADGSSSSVTVKVTNKGCNLESAAAQVVYFVKLAKAQLAITSPTEGAILLAKDNGAAGTATVYATTMQVSIAEGTPGATVSVFCRKAGLGLPYPNQPVGQAVYNGGAALAVETLLDIDVLSSSVTCKAVDDAPNPATSAVEVAFQVGLPAPQLTIVQPAQAITVTTYELPVVLQASNLDGRDVSAVLTAAGGVATTAQVIGKVAANGLIAKVLLQDNGNKLLDGTYVLSLDATDVFGNSAAANLASSVTATFSLDTTAPVVVIAPPTKDNYEALVDVDSSPKAGYQIDVTVAIDDAAQVCLTPPAGSKICKTVGVDYAAGDATVVFAGVTLQPGPNNLAVDGKDAAGNQSPLAPKLVTLVSDAPLVKFVQPAGNVITIADTVAFTALVAKADGTPVETTTFKVLVDGVELPTAVTAVGQGQYTFAVAVPKDGKTALVQFGAAADGTPDKMGFSAEIGIVFKTAKPGLSLSVPADKAVLNLASPLCAPGSTDCVTQVQLTASDIEDGSPVAVSVDCGAGKTQALTGSIQGGKASLAVTFPDQSACTLAAAATDAAGQVANAAAVSISVDRVAPKVLGIVSPIGKAGTQIAFVAAEDVGGNPLDGLQVNLQAQFAGVAQGQKVSLQVIDDGGVSVGTFEGTVSKDTPDSGFVSVSFGLVSMPDGDKVKLVFSAPDASGNVGTLTVTAKVASAKPLLQLGDPINNTEGVSCTANSQCGIGVCASGQCAAVWNKTAGRKVVVFTAGLPSGSVVNVCAKGPAGLNGAPCQTAGFVQVGTTTTQGNQVVFTLPQLADGLYTLIAEGSFLPLVPWTSTLESSFSSTKQRTLLIDTAAPAVTLTAPSAPNALGPCLNGTNETKADGGAAGGTFVYDVDATEAGSLALFSNGAPIGTVSVSVGKSTISVSLPAEGTQVVSFKAADAAGNNVDGILAAVVVDTQKPIGAFAVPSGPKVIVGSPLDVQVTQISPDAEGLAAEIKDGGVSKGSVAVTAGSALYPNATFGLLSQGDHTLTAEIRDFCGNLGVVGTNPSKVTVDLQPPLASFTAPDAAKTFGDADDAAPTVGGYQVSATFATTDAVSYKLELADGCDATFGGCGALQTVKAGAITAPNGAEPPLLVTIPFGGGTPQYQLKLTVTDANGNTAVATRGFKVQLSGCLVSLTGLSNGGVYNTQNCATPGQDCASVAAKVTAEFIGPCGQVANLQLKKGSSEVAKLVPGADQKAVFDVTLTDGDKTTLEAIALDGGGQAIKSSGALAVQADLTSPKVAFAAATVLGTATAVDKDLLGKAKDLNGNAGHQAHLQLQVSDAGLSGGSLTKLERTVGNAVTALAVGAPASLPVAFAAATATVDVQFATLAEDAANTLTATVTDAAGNSGKAQITVTVDWQAPAAVKLADLKDADLNVRRPMAKLSFTATGDNGSQGQAASYDVRYSKKPINTQADFDAACNAKDLPSSTIGTPKASGQADEVFVEGPDPRDLSDPCKFTPHIDSGASAWYFAVTAVDAAGNRSVPSNTVSTTALRVRYANIVLGGTQATTDMRSRLTQVGDLNGDGLGDLALGGGVSSPLCIVYGRNGATVADIDLSLASAYPSHFCLSNPGGLGLPTARGTGDVNGDGIDDLVVGLGVASSGQPRSVRVYLGKKGAAISGTPVLTINNLESLATSDGVWKLSIIGNFNGDTSPSGKPIADIAVTGRAGLVAYDRVFIVPGSAAWSEAAPKTIDVNSATSRAQSNVATVRLTDSSGAPAFGTLLLNTGNMLADNGATQYDDIAIGQLTSAQAVYVLKGRPVSGDTEILLSRTLVAANDAEAVYLLGNSAIAQTGFGIYGAVANLDNDGIPDLVLQHSSAAALGGGLYWLKGAVIAANLGKQIGMGQEQPVAGQANLFALSGGLGYRVRDYHFAPQALGNFADRPATGKPLVDIVHSRSSAAADGGNNRVIIRLGIVRPKSAIPSEVSYQLTDLAIYDPANNAKTNWGNISTATTGAVSVAPLGDFNGDGLPDLAIGSLDGSLVVVY